MDFKTELISAYNKEAELREDRKMPEWKLSLRDEFLDIFQSENKETLLEIGAGTGKDSLYFQENGIDVTAIDITPEMVSLCKSKGINAIEMDMYALDFEDDAFDAVYSFNSLLHVPKKDAEIVISEIQRVLKKGGIFYCVHWGGYDHEGTLENDLNVPKRFFSFYDNEAARQIYGEYFAIREFQPIPINDYILQKILMCRE